MGSTPSWGTKIPHAEGQLSFCATAREGCALWWRATRCSENPARSPPTKDLNSDPSLTSVFMYFTWLIVSVLTTMPKYILHFLIGRHSLWWGPTWKQMLNSLLLVVLVLFKILVIYGCSESLLWHVGSVLLRGLSRVVASRGYSLIAACRLLFAMASLVVEQGSGAWPQ